MVDVRRECVVTGVDGRRSPFIFRQPSRSAVSNVFLLPFSGGVWAASGGVAAVAALLLAALRRAPAPPPARAQLLHLTLPDTCTFALGTLCQQGPHLRIEHLCVLG